MLSRAKERLEVWKLARLCCCSVSGCVAANRAVCTYVPWANARAMLPARQKHDVAVLASRFGRATPHVRRFRCVQACPRRALDAVRPILVENHRPLWVTPLLSSPPSSPSGIEHHRRLTLRWGGRHRHLQQRLKMVLPAPAVAMAAPRGTYLSRRPRPRRPRKERRKGARRRHQRRQRVAAAAAVAVAGETDTQIATTTDVSTITGTAATGTSTAGKKQVSSMKAAQPGQGG